MRSQVMLIFIQLAAFCLLGRSSVVAQQQCPITAQHLSDPPYEDYFYSDCNVDAQVVITSPLPDSNLTIIGPRLIVAWPAGDSGICTFFQPLDGPNGTLAIELVNSTIGTPLSLVRNQTNSSSLPAVGVQGVLSFNSSATLTVPILGSIRAIRDFTEGPSLLHPVLQDAINVSVYNGTGALYSRLWLDNVTVSTFSMVPINDSIKAINVDSKNKTISFQAGLYHFETSLSYPQLTQLTPQEVLNNQSQVLITQDAGETTSLSFLSYSEKLLAGAWRFLTYFGRDSMISAFLLEPVLSTGNGSAMEAVIGAVLERINRTDGSVCHEETIGDYATFLNLEDNITSTDPVFSYPMIDTDLYLPILMSLYFGKYPSRVQPLLSRKAGSVDVQNTNLTYGDLALLNAQKIVNNTAAFTTNQTVQNLLHLKPDQLVGDWRDSTYGLANGRIPFDVNCALAPAALRAIAALSAIPGVFPNFTAENYSTTALIQAEVWENSTLPFFEYNLTLTEANARLEQFVTTSTFYNGSTHNTSLTNATYGADDSTLTFYALSLNGTTNTTAIAAQKIPIEHTDTGFHLFLLNSTSTNASTSALYTRLLNATANSILSPFPAGLLTPVGAVVANPALSNSSVLIANFTNSAYHGTVVWSWQLGLMAAGLERQLARCGNSSHNTSAPSAPPFCADTVVYGNVLNAYNTLWNTIEANSAQLESEVWSWTFTSGTNGTAGGGYSTTPLGALPPPPGVGGGTESDIRQLWSLGFLAVTRNHAYA